MSEGYYLHLQPSETAVFGAAANIFASYVATNQVTEDNEAEMMKKAIRAAISIARYVEKYKISLPSCANVPPIPNPPLYCAAYRSNTFTPHKSILPVNLHT